MLDTSNMSSFIIHNTPWTKELLSPFYKRNKLQTPQLENDTWVTLPASGRAGFWAQAHPLAKLVPLPWGLFCSGQDGTGPVTAGILHLIPGPTWSKVGPRAQGDAAQWQHPEGGEIQTTSCEKWWEKQLGPQRRPCKVMWLFLPTFEGLLDRKRDRHSGWSKKVEMGLRKAGTRLKFTKIKNRDEKLFQESLPYGAVRSASLRVRGRKGSKGTVI